MIINDNSERCDKMDNYIIRMILDDFEKILTFPYRLCMIQGKIL